MAAQGLSLCELVRTSAMYLPARRSSTLPHSTGPSPSGRSFGSDQRRRSSGGDPGPFALTPFLSTSPRSDSWHRFGRTFACAYIHPYHRGLQAGLCVPCFSPFLLVLLQEQRCHDRAPYMRRLKEPQFYLSPRG